MPIRGRPAVRVNVQPGPGRPATCCVFVCVCVCAYMVFSLLHISLYIWLVEHLLLLFRRTVHGFD